MIKPLAFVLALAFLFAAPAGAQTMVLSQSVDSQTVNVTLSFGCHAAGIVRDQSYWRTYTLSNEGITQPIVLTAVSFGVERSIPGSGAPGVPVDVNIYCDGMPTVPGAALLDTTGLLLVHTEPVVIPQQFTTVLTVPLSIQIPFPANSTIVVEIANQDLTAQGHSFFIGANPNGQTNPAYFSSGFCNITPPQDMFSFNPNIHAIIDLEYFVPNQVIDFPGTGDDLELTSAIGSGNPLTTGPAVDIKQAMTSEVMVLNVASPGGTFDLLPYFFLTQVFITGTTPVGPLPSIHFDLSQPVFVLVDGNATSPFGPNNLINPGVGNTHSYVTPPGFSSLSAIFQALMVTTVAGNGIFATTDSHVIVFL